MGEAERSHVLKRKAQTGREEHQARVMTPPRALRLALSRVAEDLFGLALSVSSIHVAASGQDATIAAFADDRLIMVLDGPGGAIGAASVDLAVLSGLIEMQTIGHVVKRDPDPRPPTQTDAALVAPLLDGMLAGFAENLAENPEAFWVRGYRFGAMIDEPRLLGLLLESPDFHLFRLEVDLGNGAKTGEIVLALPGAAELGGGCPAGGVHEDAAEAGTAGCRLRMDQGALMGAEAPMAAVLHRISLPLNEIGTLKPGDVLTIPRDALSDTRLEAGGGRGGVACRLGQINGFRAVRLSAAAHGIGEDGPQMDAAASLPGAAGFEPDMADPGGLSGPGVAPETGLGGAPGIGPGGLEGLDGPGGLGLAAVGAELSDQPDALPDIGDLGDLPALGAATGDSDGVGALPDLPDLPAVPELTDLPDLGDMGDMGDMGDLSDLPELALDE